MSHKSRKHNPHSLEDFKHAVFQTYSNQGIEDGNCLLDDSEFQPDEVRVSEDEDLDQVNVDKLGSLLLKLDCIFNVPNRCIDEIVEELQFITRSASAPIIKNIVCNTLQSHDCIVEE